MTTNDMMRLESMASWMLTPLFDVALGTSINVSIPSNTERKAWSFPSLSKLGRILSKNCFNIGDY